MLNPGLAKAKAPAVYDVKCNTTKGDFTIEVTRAWAPNGADRFYNLVKGGFFDGAPVYRVIPGFMAQFGFSPNVAVNRAWDKATIKDDHVAQSNTRGMVTFAQTGAPNSRSTHIFINYGNNARLDPQNFAPFGKVIEGMDVVEKFYSGYGETDQEKLANGGIAYVKKSLPNLDIINSCEIAPSAAPVPAPGTAK
jgi:peptidyl-prolyl cis-trans isomerase A (cyclophilin A)